MSLFESVFDTKVEYGKLVVSWAEFEGGPPGRGKKSTKPPYDFVMYLQSGPYPPNTYSYVC